MYYINYFFVFAILGHFIESLLNSNGESGVLFGYWTPIYGVGTIIVLLLNKYLKRTTFTKLFNATLLFIYSAILLSTIEMIGGYLIKFIFNKELWNYSDHIFNIGKYTSLEMAGFWGLTSLILIYIIKPFMDKIIRKVPSFIGYTLIIGFVIDIVISLITINNVI